VVRHRQRGGGDGRRRRPLFGISFGLLPALLLLSVLAIYDAISVYGTEHMLDLADGVMDLKIPVVLVIPMTLSYSYLEAGSTDDVLEDDRESNENAPDESATDESTADGAPPTGAPPTAVSDDAAAAGSSDTDADERDTETDAETDADTLERDALFIGLGDAVIPSILVASAAYFLEAGTLGSRNRAEPAGAGCDGGDDFRPARAHVHGPRGAPPRRIAAAQRRCDRRLPARRARESGLSLATAIGF